MAHKSELHRKLGEYREAVAAYDRALALDPAQANAWYEKGECHAALGKTVKR
jgi:tetratricopeptide (TPR) repeat protein